MCHFVDICPRRKSVRLAGFNHRVKKGANVGAINRFEVKKVLPPHNRASLAAFRHIVINWHIFIGQKIVKTFPLCVIVVDCFSQSC